MQYTPLEKLDQIRDLIEKSQINKDEILNLIIQLFNDIGYMKSPSPYQVNQVYRAVIYKNESDIDSMSKFDIVPLERAKLNRCNWPGEQAFYCSNDNAVPVFETRAKDYIGQYLTNTTWVFNRNQLRENIIPIRFDGVAIGAKRIVETLSEDDEFRKLLLKDDVFKVYTPKIIRDFDAAIGELFIEPSSDSLYWLTSAIAKVFIEYMYFPGLIYPSVESNRTGVNTVFRKEYYDLYFRNQGVAVYKITDYNEKTKEYRLTPIKTLCRFDEQNRPMWQKNHSKHAGEDWVFSTETPITPWREGLNLTVEKDCTY